jgi:hypothetical protein
MTVELWVMVLWIGSQPFQAAFPKPNAHTFDSLSFSPGTKVPGAFYFPAQLTRPPHLGCAVYLPGDKGTEIQARGCYHQSATAKAEDSLLTVW